MIFKTLTLKNFKSHIDTSINFNKGTTIILGKEKVLIYGKIIWFRQSVNACSVQDGRYHVAQHFNFDFCNTADPGAAVLFKSGVVRRF